MKKGTARSAIAPPARKNMPNMIEQHSRLAYPSTNLKLPSFFFFSGGPAAAVAGAFYSSAKAVAGPSLVVAVPPLVPSSFSVTIG